MEYVYEYVYKEELASRRERGQQQAQWALEEARKLVALLEANPDLPFVGNAYVDDWHALDGSWCWNAPALSAWLSGAARTVGTRCSSSIARMLR